MGYDLSIKKDNSKISKSEWLHYILTDPEFEKIDEFSAQIPSGPLMTIQIPDSGLWNKEVPFTFREEDGKITVKNPDLKIIEKMVSISIELGASVMGEEGEKYDKEYIEKEKNKAQIDMELVENLKIKPFDPNKRWWQFWK